MYKRIASTTTLAFLLASSPIQAAGDDAGSFGRLMTGAEVELFADSRSIATTDSEYAYFAGEVIVTSAEGGAVLTVEDGAIQIGPSTRASVDGRSGAYRVHLSRGALAIRLDPASWFEVAAADVRIRPRAGARTESDQPVDAFVRVGASGGLAVESRRGELEVFDTAGNLLERVAEREAVAFGAAAAHGSGGNDFEESRPRVQKRWILPVSACSATVYTVRELARSDSDDDVGPASPVSSPVSGSK